MKRSLVRNQIDLMEEIIRTSKINMVNCGHCGGVFLHRTSEETLNCPWCDREDMDPSDCPDFIYEGMPEESNSDEIL